MVRSGGPEGTVLSGPLVRRGRFFPDHWSGGDGSFRTTDPVNGINTENGLSISYISSNPNSENHFVPPEFRPFPLYNKGAP